MQAVLVTSAAPDEGKSILAWNLALSLARTDKRTLFIDANLRNPGLHNHFDIASHPGLSELLRGEKDDAARSSSGRPSTISGASPPACATSRPGRRSTRIGCGGCSDGLGRTSITS